MLLSTELHLRRTNVRGTALRKSLVFPNREGDLISIRPTPLATNRQTLNLLPTGFPPVSRLDPESLSVELHPQRTNVRGTAPLVFGTPPYLQTNRGSFRQTGTNHPSVNKIFVNSFNPFPVLQVIEKHAFISLKNRNGSKIHLLC